MQVMFLWESLSMVCVSYAHILLSDIQDMVYLTLWEAEKEILCAEQEEKTAASPPHRYEQCMQCF